MKLITAVVILFSYCTVGTMAELNQCGVLAGGAGCSDGRCCSIWGYCGDTDSHCGLATCHSKCFRRERPDHRCGELTNDAPCGRFRCCSNDGWCGEGSDYCSDRFCDYQCWGYSSLHRNNNRTLDAHIDSDVLTEFVFNKMFGHRKDCPSQGFYSFRAFRAAAQSFPGFGTTGDVATRKREIAAFLAQLSQATSGEQSNVENPNSWGLCHINTTVTENNDFCTSSGWPCASGKNYGPRGAIQLVHNFYYGLAGEAIGKDLINNPELVATNPVVSFKTAIWFWMTQHDNKPSCHDIVVNADSNASRAVVPRNDVIGNIIKHAFRLGNTGSSALTYYKRYCDMLGVSYGSDLKYWFHKTSSSNFPRIKMSVEA